MNEPLDDLIKEHAGQWSITHIAAQAGVSAECARRRAREMGIDTRVPAYAPADKATYSIRVSKAEAAGFAAIINDVMKRKDIRTQNEAIQFAVNHYYGGVDR